MRVYPLHPLERTGLTMATTTKITRKTAEKALAVVERHYAQWFKDGWAKPTLIDRGTYWEIVWEEGPYEWALRATHGGVNEEFLYNVYPEFVTDFDKAVANATTKPIKFPATVYVEPVNTCTLAIYRP